jgi:hypothetical protein
MEHSLGTVTQSICMSSCSCTAACTTLSCIILDCVNLITKRELAGSIPYGKVDNNTNVTEGCNRSLIHVLLHIPRFSELNYTAFCRGG